MCMLIQTKAQYYSSVGTIYCKPGCYTAFLGRHTWQLTHAPREASGDCMLSHADLETIFSPDWSWREEEGKLFIIVNDLEIQIGDKESLVSVRSKDKPETCQKDMKTPAGRFGGEWFLPMKGFFKEVLGNHFAYSDPYYMISDTLEEIDRKKAWLYMDIILSGRKTYGDFYETFWYEEAQRIVPYRLYIPTTYRKGTPSKLIVGLHGANSDHNAIFERSNGKLARLAEERGYIILAVNGLYYRSFYGYCYPTSGGVNSRNIKGNEENPLMLTDVQLKERWLSQNCIMATIDTVMKNYAIDKEKIFMMGNSMGGAGTIWLAGQNPGMFRAISPSGGNVSPRYFQVESLGDTPVLFVVGTEDDFGAYHQDDAAEEFVKRGSNYTMCYVGGGNHSFAWSYALNQVFDFFDKQ